MPAGVDLDIPGSHGPSSTPAKHRATRPLRGAALAAAISAVPKPTAKASEQKTKQRPATWFWCDPQSGAVAAEVLRGRQACRVLEQLVVNGTSGAAAAGQGAQQCKQQLLAACVQVRFLVMLRDAAEVLPLGKAMCSPHAWCSGIW